MKVPRRAPSLPRVLSSRNPALVPQVQRAGLIDGLSDLQVVSRIVDNTINGKIAKQVFGFMWEEGKTADAIIAEKGLNSTRCAG